MSFIDLRSDTVTRPSEEMRRYIAEAEVGDDVYGEDPTVNTLQARIAELTGKEAALFVTSGTQANQVSINAHTQPGDEVICEYASHIFNFEAGSPGMLSGVQLHPIKGKRGVLDINDVAAAIRPENHHFAQTRLICLENTHNRWGGSIYPLEEMKKIRELAGRKGLAVHLDGARLWNASVATGIPLKSYTRLADSVSLCFSKGLGAPVGSIVAGTRSFIDRAHYYRKAYGGGLRQAGLLAAGALFALDHNLERLADDHRRAKALARAISDLPGCTTDAEHTETNIVIFSVSARIGTAAEISRKLKENGILISAISEQQLRAVTNLNVSDDDMDRVISTFQGMFS